MSLLWEFDRAALESIPKLRRVEPKSSAAPPADFLYHVARAALCVAALSVPEADEIDLLPGGSGLGSSMRLRSIFSDRCLGDVEDPLEVLGLHLPRRRDATNSLQLIHVDRVVHLANWLELVWPVLEREIVLQPLLFQ